MLVKRESTSRIPIRNSESCSTIFPAKTSGSFTVYPLLVKDFKVGTRNFANSASYDNFIILTHENKMFLLELKESLLIIRDKPS